MREIAIIPRPVKTETRGGAFALSSSLRIACDRTSCAAAEQLAAMLAPFSGAAPTVVDEHATGPTPTIAVRLLGDPTKLGHEGYALDIKPAGIEIIAAAPAGLAWANQTVRQLLPIDGAAAALPSLKIEDRPRYSWRGLMLDVGRHFYPVAFIKRFIDLAAQHKYNVFHWHLTEDQGWRIAIDKYPRLTEIGAWRDDGNGGRTGGFYTKADVREIVAYAATRHITVVPEIELPGHCQAALAAYPERSCTGGPFHVSNRWGVHDDVYCAGKERTFEFLHDVIGEVIDLFPSRWFHIGGDECPKTRWQECADCQARIKSERLKDEHELQSWFVKRIEKFLNANGRRLIGWDEILEGGLAPGATVMSWRGTSGGIAAAQSGHDVIMTPTSHCYLDYSQTTREGEPPTIPGGYL